MSKLTVTLLAVVPFVIIGCAASQLSTLQPQTDISVHDLRCEYKTNPLGIDITKPRLSWTLRSDTRAQRQTAYQILVATSPAKLENNKPDLWNSGKVLSDLTNQIVYKGKPLKSQMKCCWKVRVWDKDGKVSDFSRPASWSMALLKKSDFKAKWIGFDSPRQALPEIQVGYNKTINAKLPPACCLRKGFTLDKPVKRATIYASALGIYELHINGNRVGNDYFSPGWTHYKKRIYYNTYDVTDMLRSGKNAIAAVLADGWYSGYLGWNGKRDHYGNKTRFLAQLHIEYQDGSNDLIVTDTSFKANTGPILEADFYMGETYDATKEITGWTDHDYDDTFWKPVDVTPQIDAPLQAYPGVPVRIFDRVTPVSMNEPEPGVFVFDMGRNFAGFARLKVKGPRGHKVTLRFAERLNEDGTVYLTSLRLARAADTYICKGMGEELYQPRFTFHGFQYVEVTGYPGTPTIDDVTGLALSSDTPLAGAFQCSDEMANKLYKNIVTTQRANFIEVPTDCPQRDERLGWTGDAQVFVRTATYNNDVAAFFTKWLIDLEDAQRSDGAFPHVAPRVVVGDCGSAAWADAGVICPWTIYQVYGDKRVLEKHYDAMAAWIDFCKNTSYNLIRPAEGYGDWLSINAETDKAVLATAYFAYSTKLMARAARALGRKSDALKYNQLFGKIKKRFNEKFVADDGTIKSDTQTVYVLALEFGLLDPDKRAIAVQRLVDNIRERNWHLSTGFIGTKDLMTTLTEIGRTDIAYKLFGNDTFPSWGFSIKQGATSIWERWDGWTPEKGFQDAGMNSFAHYSFGAVAEWMFKTVAGIDTDGPGYRKIIIKPQPGGKLTWAKASYDSINGKIATNWKIDGDNLTLDVTIPANTTATVYIPTVDVLLVTESGKTAAFDQVPGVDFLRSENGTAVFHIGSGNYGFSSEI